MGTKVTIKRKKASKDEPEKKSKKKKAEKVVRTKGKSSTGSSHDTHFVDPKDKIVEEHLDKSAAQSYYDYGVAVIEDRAIFGDDGCKPVARRYLWAAHKLGLHSMAKAVKAATVVGETLGKYHPHGDTAVYGAIVTGAKAPVRMIDGEGNWGTMVDGPAAMRYTNMRLSMYSDLVFFDKFYLPTIQYVPNFDGSTVEPLVLPTLLPNAIINGNFGIAPGVNTRTPTFSLKSIFDLLETVLAQKKPVVTPEMCMDLVFTSKYGGRVPKNKIHTAEKKTFFKTGRGAFTFISTATAVNEKENSIRIEAFAPIADIAKTLKAIDEMKGVASTLGDADKSDRYEAAYKVFFNKNVKGEVREALIKKVMSKFSSVVRFSVQTTDRFLKPNGTAGAKLRPTTVPELINKWINDRFDLERRACTYWIERRKEEIADLELLRLAVKMRDFIITAIKEKEKLSDEDLEKYIAKGLKITVEQAKRILDLKIRQLRKLEDTKLAAKIKLLKAESDDYTARHANPRKYVLKHVKHLRAELAKMPDKPVWK